MVAGKMVIEVHPDGMDKGRAIRTFMEELPFRGRRPVYLGDDRPDEAGFDFVNKADGISILVGSAFQSIARNRLDGVSEVIAWLNGFAFGPSAAEEQNEHPR
jgi:trehalose 6-phosphate phosphatase